MKENQTGRKWHNN